MGNQLNMTDGFKILDTIPFIKSRYNLKNIKMEKLLLSLLCIICVYPILAQGQDTESEIRRLEQMEVQAVLKKDTVTLLKLWDTDYVVNAPDNKINFAGKNTLDRPVLQRSRTSFTRDVEQIIVRGDIVFSMGSETVVPTGSQTNPQQTVKRRYTNIWMKKDGTWKLVARHANVICQ
jgi:ketosteroid isomerase-like protein